ATIYETEEQQSKIYEQQIIISRNRMYLSAILIFTFAVIILTFVIWINSKKISRKNRALFNQIEKLSALHNKIQNHRQPTANNENDLFVNLEKYMAEKQLFLNPDITRENVATTLNTNKNYLSNSIRDNLDLTFGEYLNLLRLEYAKDLLLNNLDIKVESVSFMSGFNSVRTFYRLFQKKYNLTPTEFKSIASQRNK
ncbi:MAG: helix-turn-helix domain-containing protein, partial [Muribaculaceae bacterium]